MKFIPEYLVKNVTYTNDDQTLYIDLPKNDQISHLHLEFSAQGVATPRTTTTWKDKISRYEVIADGMKTIYNLEPELAYWVHFLTLNGIYPEMSFNYTPNARETHRFIIPFGRHLFDEDYLFDTGLYDNVQLRIPYAITGSNFTSGTVKLNCVMWRPESKLSPVGFIRNRVVKKETTSGSAETKTHDLPMGLPIRYIATRFEDVNVNCETQLASIKIGIDEGRSHLLDMNSNELNDFQKFLFPRTNGYLIMPACTDATAFTAHTDYPFPTQSFSSGVRALIWKLAAAAGDQLTINIYEADGTTASGGHAVQFGVGGPAPHQVWTLFDGRNGAFNAPDFSEAKIEYNMNAYVSILHTLVQEIVTGKLT